MIKRLRGAAGFIAAVVPFLVCLVPACISASAAESPRYGVSSAEQVAASPESPLPIGPGGRDVLILLDTSGSMADKDRSGTVKIGAAKNAILQQMQELPVSARLGLMTYPSKSGSTKSGCRPPQLRLPVSSSSLTDMSPALGILPPPDGGTPTSDAMIGAAQYLKNEGLTDVTIVLVSDGESNCGATPCNTAKQLKSENVHLAVNTVGFDISPKDSRNYSALPRRLTESMSMPRTAPSSRRS
ncbi:VWA domain-containing protein [Arthrobacter sp. 24S4-2]|nr:VWA domain-containing protein [Arthrobacter sp. 24S4-2]